MCYTVFPADSIVNSIRNSSAPAYKRNAEAISVDVKRLVIAHDVEFASG